jgi:hypothetical protein
MRKPCAHARSWNHRVAMLAQLWRTLTQTRSVRGWSLSADAATPLLVVALSAEILLLHRSPATVSLVALSNLLTCSLWRLGDRVPPCLSGRRKWAALAMSSISVLQTAAVLCCIYTL